MTGLMTGCQVRPTRGRGQRRLRLADLPEVDGVAALGELLRDREVLAAGAGGTDDMPGTIGTTYLIHFTDDAGAPARYVHAGHYLGWASNLLIRMAQHRAGVAAGGARLLEVIYAAGLRAVVSRLWLGTTRAAEAQFKSWHAPYRLCPVCDPAAVGRGRRPWAAAWEQTGTNRWRWAW